MDYKVTYTSIYEYETDVILNDDTLKIVPYDGDNQILLDHEVGSVPEGYKTFYRDIFGNIVYKVKVEESHRRLEVYSRSKVRVDQKVVRNHEFPYDFGFNPFLLPTKLVDPEPFREVSRELVKELRTMGEVIERVVKFVKGKIKYKNGVTNIYTTALEAYNLGYGVCQDYTHVTLAIFRSLGIPARYAMGVVNDKPRATHAWVEVLTPDGTYLDVDPTRGKLYNLGYIKFAIGRDFTDVSPVTGSFISAGKGWLKEVKIKVERNVT
ncbi:transglutaminase family protein [Metallosphaera hakonensis]|uniref:Transglutaminase family protein n=1 Tax=Metallosphaera hakonensis JCM 8857 = DSM 7519 TaxID=1293036 RepID=A0A2U9IWD3_9CREN|nr:transglutaminase family protein [Metallosphaera hakonensis]AWS00360.1 transglutaminase family protein [Metallosphaera hakonensis JCM 8857 = DSM 7519]